jgi:hypothetical protein
MTRSKFASLTAGLLARKGEAEPAATPFADQLLTRVGAPAQEVRLSPMPRHTGFGLRQATPVIPPDVPSLYTDPFDELPQAAPTPPPPRVVALRSVAPPALELSCEQCPSPEDAGKVYHVNLRLKRQRFVRLKLAAALMRKPVQVIVGEALDAWFETLPGDVKGGCACLAGKEN